MMQTERRNSAKTRRATILLFLNHTPPTIFLRAPGEIHVRFVSPKIVVSDLITATENYVMHILQISSPVSIQFVAAH
jgi:hypothetical protein